jgi:hypothetical protein
MQGLFEVTAVFGAGHKDKKDKNTAIHEWYDSGLSRKAVALAEPEQIC